MTERVSLAAAAVSLPGFTDVFGRLPEAAATAPCLVNLLGDRADSLGGYVLAMPLPQETQVEVALREDRTLHVWSASLDARAVRREYRLDHVNHDPAPDERPDHLQAVAAVLEREGHRLPGMDVRVVSSVPPETGLSSGTSVLVAMLRAVRNALRLDLPDTAVARLAHRAETEVLGAPTGPADPIMCALGRPGWAFFLDTATAECEHIPIPLETEWIVMTSGVTRSHAAAFGQQRRRECEEACALLGLRSMRDLQGAGRQAVLSRIDELPAPLDARARHVVTENERVLTGMELLEEGNMRGFGSVMNASHTSLRSHYEVSVPETDLLTDLACAEDGVYGARLAGADAGESVVIAVEAGMGTVIAERIADSYRRRTGHDSSILLALPLAALPRAA